ncbi:hypothetical protein [Curtobacterium oceanosedimentum]|uniref:Integral membrane protein n=1 Tax=Curtobacterium oceanosedimentum TaxID=465820 RepID=A0A147DM42_9MICO|nr:hypothetical protein [Curtobacterium oceanosedimentum]KTR47305.1 hypothetical protein NS359_15165 [Curtobacterium oceanosedimentum]
MISTDGAALIAGVIPVGLLVLVLELRRTLLTLAIEFRFLWIRIVFVLLLFVGGLGSSVAVLICVISVSSGEAIRGFFAGFVLITGFALASTVGGAIAFAIGRMTAVILARASDEEIRKFDL